MNLCLLEKMFQKCSMKFRIIGPYVGLELSNAIRNVRFILQIQFTIHAQIM